MVYFKEMKKSQHYVEHHEREAPWDEVVEVIFATKNARKKGAKFEIENKKYYILFEIKNKILYVINAKKVR